MSQVVETFRVATRPDMGKLRLFVPVRLAIGVVIPLALGIVLGNTPLGVSAALGSFICAVADIGDTYPLRARVMVITSICIFITSTLGGLISESPVVIVLVSLPVAAICGYAASIGPRGAMIGMLSLVIFCLFAGAPVGDGVAWHSGLAVLAGSLFQAGLSISGWPLRRFGGVRGAVADGWRTLSVAAGGSPSAMLSPAVPGALVTGVGNVAASTSAGVSRQWLTSLGNDAEQIRLAMAAISGRRIDLAHEPDRAADLAALDNYADAVAVAARSIARALVLPIRRHGIPLALDRLDQAHTAAAEVFPHQVGIVQQSFADAAAAFSPPLPIGRHGQTGPSDVPQPQTMKHLRENFTWQSPVLRHAIRLSLAIGFAWILAYLVLSDHQYWLPLTVAWVTRPDYGGTVGRVIARVLGTLIGLVIVEIALTLWLPGHWGFVGIVFVSAIGLYAALPVNYAVAVIFVTSLILALLEEVSGVYHGTLDQRGLATILAGIVVLIASRIGPSFSAPLLGKQMADLAALMRPYANTVLRSDESAADQAPQLIAARTQVAVAIESAKLEPHKHAMDPNVCAKVLDAMLSAIFALLTVETGKQALIASDDGHKNVRNVVDPRSPNATAVDAKQLDDDLATLEASLRAMPDVSQARSAVASEVDKPRDPADAAIRRALRYLAG